MAAVEPTVIDFWDRLKTVAHTVTGGDVWYDLSDTDAVLQGYGPVPPTMDNVVYLLPPRCQPEHGISLGSYHRKWTYPVLAFFQATGTSSADRIKAGNRGGHDLLQAWEGDRFDLSSGPFNGLPVRDLIVRNCEAEDASPLGASGHGIFYCELLVNYTVAPETGGL